MPCKIEIRKTINETIDKYLPYVDQRMYYGRAIAVAKKINERWANLAKAVKGPGDSASYIFLNINPVVEREFKKQLAAEKEFKRDFAFFNYDEALYEQEQAEDRRYEQGKEQYFQLENIFRSVVEIETKLNASNKTANSIGSEKKIDELLKKAGLDSEIRKQFIELLNNNPSLKSIKISEVLSSYLKTFIKDSDKQYYKAIDEPLSNELEDVLIDYFDKFKIRRQELDNLKEKFGVDSVGVFDVLAKTVYYSKNRNLLTLPEEYGHVFVELLGSISSKKADNPLFTYLFNNIESWDGYDRVYKDYKDKYVTAEGNIDIYKIKKEAIGQAIGIALVRNYKVQKGDKTFWEKIQSVIDYVLDMIKGIDYVSLNTTVDNIAKDILSKNYSKLDRLKKDTSNYNLLSYSETIHNQNRKDGGKALGFMKYFSDLGNVIAGSLAYRLQGTTYRPEIDALHDIDMMVPADVHNISLDKSTYLNAEELESDKMYRKLISEGNYKEAKKYKIEGNLLLDLEELLKNEYFIKIQKDFPDLEFLYSIFNQKANVYYITISGIYSENQELKDRFKSYSGSYNQRLEKFTPEEQAQIYLFDFFLRPEKSNEFVGPKDEEFGLNLSHFSYSFYEKLNTMGRPKDAYDYQMWNYYDEKNILAPDFNDRLVYFQINESEKRAPKIPVVYSAIFFNTDELTSKYKPVHPNVFSHHSTIEFKPADINELPLGESKNIKITGRLTTDKVDVLLVDNPLSNNKYPHITLSTAEGVKPFESNTEIENNLDKIVKLDDSIDGVVGIFDGKNEITSLVKPGVSELFESNPELANAGTVEQYSQYLDSIFPDSKVKDIVYHGTDDEYRIFNNKVYKLEIEDLPNNTIKNINTGEIQEISQVEWEKLPLSISKIFTKPNININIRGKKSNGIWFTNKFNAAKTFGGRWLANSYILNVKNPEIIDQKGNYIEENLRNIYSEDFKNRDSVVLTNVRNYIPEMIVDETSKEIGINVVIFDPQQIHILGSKQDIEGFKEFVSDNIAEYAVQAKPTSSVAETQSEGAPSETAESYDDSNIYSFTVPQDEFTTQRKTMRVQIDKFINQYLDEKAAGSNVIFPSTGVGQDLIQIDSTTGKISADTSPLARETFIYLSQKLYKNFGYKNPNYESVVKGEKVAEQPEEKEIIEITDDDVRDSFLLFNCMTSKRG